jgi:hypothetical protein
MNMYPENFNCPCFSDLFCCPGDDWHNENCPPCESANECCPGDSFETNPFQCPCKPLIDSNHCCPTGTFFDKVGKTCCTAGDLNCCDKFVDPTCGQDCPEVICGSHGDEEALL